METEIDKILLSIRELRESQKKTGEYLRETSREIRESQRKTDEQLRKTDEQLQRTDVRLNNLNRKMEGFFGNYGEATEELFYRSLEERMRLGDIEFERIERRVRINGDHAEFDIVLFNGECIGIIEVKSKAHPKDIEGLVAKKIQRFKADCPELSGLRFYFGIASMVTNRALVDRAREEGIFLLTQKGGHVEIVNSEARAF